MAWVGSMTFWAFVVAGVILIGIGTVVLRRMSDRSERTARVRVQVVLVVLALLVILGLIVTAPLEESVRNGLLAVYGLILTAAIGLTATTYVGNGLAGLILRSQGTIKGGDFVRSGEHFGRVTDLGLLHTEIQTEDRDLTLLPNLQLVTEPVTVMRSSGTIVSAEVSLGYDVPHPRVERLLTAAAEDAGLAEPRFVLVIGLGDFSVAYRVAGLLEQPRTFISARSRLRKAMLDRLHGAGVEIVSPAFMNQRQLDPTQLLVPPVERAVEPDAEIEALLFDKADLVESIEALRKRRSRVEERRDTLKAQVRDGGPDGEVAERRLRQIEEGLETLDARIAATEQEASDV